MKSSRLILTAILVSSLVTSPALAGAKLTIRNGDGPTEGFNDPTPATPIGGNNGTTLGQQRLIAFQRAVEIWSQIVDSDAEIVIDARFDALDCDATSAVLGAAGARWIAADFPGAPVAGTWYNGALVNRLGGEDGDPTRTEINARFNSDLGKSGCLTGAFFYYGLDNNEGTNVDLIATLLHEFAHGLGFQATVDSTTGAFPENQPDAYARFLVDNTTGKRWSEMTNLERLASRVNANNVVLDGVNVVAAAPQFLGANAPRVTVASPASIAGEYLTATAQFGGTLDANGLSSAFVLIADAANSSGPSTTDGCTTPTNAGDIAGKIALVDRGTCTFVVKATNAQAAGAIGLIVINNEDCASLPPLGGTDPAITIPVVGISKPDGAKIKAQLVSGVTGRIGLGPATALKGADANGRPLVYSPCDFQGGSSISHFDTSASPNLLMEPSINTDLESDVDLTEPLFRDLGWFTTSTMTMTMRDSLVVDDDSDGKADPGDTIRYALSIANIGGAGATSVVLTNTPDPNSTLVTGSVQTSSGTVTKGNTSGDATVQVALTGLKPAATATAQFDVVVKSGISAAATAIVNQASLAGSNFSTVPSDDPDSSAAGDATSTPLDLNPVKVDKIVILSVDADLSGGVTPGDSILYTISVKNDGTTNIADAVLTDTPDANTTIVAGSVTTSQGTITSGNEAGATSISVSLGAIAPGATATVTLSVKLNADIPTRIVLINNQATVTSSNFPAALSNDPRNSVPNDPTTVGIQQIRLRTTRR